MPAIVVESPMGKAWERERQRLRTSGARWMVDQAKAELSRAKRLNGRYREPALKKARRRMAEAKAALEDAQAGRS